MTSQGGYSRPPTNKAGFFGKTDTRDGFAGLSLPPSPPPSPPTSLVAPSPPPSPPNPSQFLEFESQQKVDPTRFNVSDSKSMVHQGRRTLPIKRSCYRRCRRIVAT